jgi:putative addiction module killer protein
MLPSIQSEIRYYVAAGGQAPFADRFEDLEVVARAKVTRALARLELGNFSNVKSVGEGVLELRIDYGPGYRVYFGRDGETLVVLLTGGTKKRQQRDIEAARAYWQDYKRQARTSLNGDGAMARTKSFGELVQQHVKRDRKFAEALLREGVDALLSGDVDTGKTILRDYIKATVGFEKLGAATGAPPKSLIRMFGPRGNPQAKNLFSVLGYLQKRAGVRLHVAG